MKKTLLTITAMVAGILSINAQCTISGSCVPDAYAGYCAVPSASTNLNAATIGTAYNSVIQFSLGTTAFNGFAAINGATLTTVSGMPAGITVAKNPVNGQVGPGQGACIQLSGTTNASAGVYTISASFFVSSNQGSQTVVANWYLPVNVSTGINTIANSSLGILVLAPNPAKSELTINSDLNLNKVTIIDALGKIVLVQELNYTNQSTLDIRSLERGVYFLQANDGSKTMTKKFIKD